MPGGRAVLLEIAERVQSASQSGTSPLEEARAHLDVLRAHATRMGDEARAQWKKDQAECEERKAATGYPALKVHKGHQEECRAETGALVERLEAKLGGARRARDVVDAEARALHKKLREMEEQGNDVGQLYAARKREHVQVLDALARIVAVLGMEEHVEAAAATGVAHAVDGAAAAAPQDQLTALLETAARGMSAQGAAALTRAAAAARVVPTEDAVAAELAKIQAESAKEDAAAADAVAKQLGLKGEAYEEVKRIFVPARKSGAEDQLAMQPTAAADVAAVAPAATASAPTTAAAAAPAATGGATGAAEAEADPETEEDAEAEAETNGEAEAVVADPVSREDLEHLASLLAALRSHLRASLGDFRVGLKATHESFRAEYEETAARLAAADKRLREEESAVHEARRVLRAAEARREACFHGRAALLRDLAAAGAEWTAVGRQCAAAEARHARNVRRHEQEEELVRQLEGVLASHVAGLQGYLRSVTGHTPSVATGGAGSVAMPEAEEDEAVEVETPVEAEATGATGVQDEEPEEPEVKELSHAEGRVSSEETPAAVPNLVRDHTPTPAEVEAEAAKKRGLAAAEEILRDMDESMRAAAASQTGIATADDVELGGGDDAGASPNTGFRAVNDGPYEGPRVSDVGSTGMTGVEAERAIQFARTYEGGAFDAAIAFGGDEFSTTTADCDTEPKPAGCPV